MLQGHGSTDEVQMSSNAKLIWERPSTLQLGWMARNIVSWLAGFPFKPDPAFQTVLFQRSLCPPSGESHSKHYAWRTRRPTVCDGWPFNFTKLPSLFFFRFAWGQGALGDSRSKDNIESWFLLLRVRTPTTGTYGRMGERGACKVPYIIWGRPQICFLQHFLKEEFHPTSLLEVHGTSICKGHAWGCQLAKDKKDCCGGFVSRIIVFFYLHTFFKNSSVKMSRHKRGNGWRQQCSQESILLERPTIVMGFRSSPSKKCVTASLHCVNGISFGIGLAMDEWSCP